MGYAATYINADLPCFPNVTSIKMSLRIICFTPRSAGELSTLEILSLSGCCITDIGSLVTRCPRLRMLKAAVAPGKITIHSASLQKLDVCTHLYSHGYVECHSIDIVTPMLKQLHLNVRAGREIDVSISTPMVENVSWHCAYTRSVLVFGSWGLQSMTVETIRRSYVDNMDGTCWQVQRLQRFHVLCLRLYAGNHMDAELNFAEEMEKLPVTNFSVLELDFESDWHVYGALVLQLLRMRQIRAATKKLKIVLPWWPKLKAEQVCLRNCSCDKPKNWRPQSIFYTCLEELEIYSFNGMEHEHDFIKLILKCSPMLKSVILRRATTFGGCTTELSNISFAHPSVKCFGNVVSSGELVLSASS